MSADCPLAALEAALAARDASAIIEACERIRAGLAAGKRVDPVALSLVGARVALLHRAVTHRLRTDRQLATGGVDAVA